MWNYDFSAINISWPGKKWIFDEVPHIHPAVKTTQQVTEQRQLGIVSAIELIWMGSPNLELNVNLLTPTFAPRSLQGEGWRWEIRNFLEHLSIKCVHMVMIMINSVLCLGNNCD